MMSLINKGFGVENLRLAFPKQKEMLLKDLTCHYKKGEKILLLGPSGCGKSTLMKVLCGLIPQSIEVPMKADNMSIPDKWGYVFQDPDSQFCMSYVDEEIAFVLENQQIPQNDMPALIDKYLKAVGLDLENSHMLIQELSGGMKQRLATASALALDPDVLFLDEPTAMLDPEGTRDLWETVRQITHGKTVVVVEHKIDHILDFIDRIILFNENGEIITDGPADDILTNYQKQLKEYGIWYPGVWEGRYGETDMAIDPLEQAEQRVYMKLDHFTVYRKKRPKVSIPELSIGRGEWVTIIGENGAGKSTLLEGMMDLLKYKGEKRWFVENDETKVSFVFQNPEFQFVTDRVSEELGFSLNVKNMDPDKIEKKVKAELIRFSLNKQKDQHPYQLSTGQKRRLSVASTLIEEPTVILLDEPTFGQDAKNTFELLELFEGFRKKGAAIVMVTHEMEIVHRFATRAIRLANGNIDEDKLTARGRRQVDGEDGYGQKLDHSQHMVL
ncbi:energy-coupling factor transport system ATP-binding protein [Scopulibacillus darangshiensis]|uniref:Energy-coupling factor transport system ATP-binding protein n=1 Tax=Scopulibacillus darangshiensis TaxID=442528 RepID=A0A4V2SNK6_9BACL|nr:ABC transporter ATP-binding protein [Scopulibacillus darangshiensis]TCP31586.1 energy-coupling factor transport system ATP-binding protein [Scopulibacillus darangshiensis]